jgi:Flp pilus assembly protein TadB
MGLVSNGDRDAAAARLRRHYLAGRLSVDELDARLHAALTARNGGELQRALRELPAPWRDADEVRRAGRLALRAAVRVALVALWLLASFVLLVAFLLTALVHGVTPGDALGFPLAWLLATVLVLRAARRA